MISIITVNFQGTRLENNDKESSPKKSEELCRHLANYSMHLDATYDWINESDAYYYDFDGYSGIGCYLPFDFPFYDTLWDQIIIWEDGYISFSFGAVSRPPNFPSDYAENVIAVFSENLAFSSSSAGVYRKILYDPYRVVFIYKNVEFSNSSSAGTFEIILYEDGLIKLQYKDVQSVGSAYCGLNRGNGEGYCNYYNNFNTTMEPYAIEFSYAPNVQVPTLSDFFLSDSSGNQSKLYTYEVNYTDLDNNNPSFVKLIVDETDYLMSKKNPSDNNYTDGCIYEYSLYLQPGTHNHYFSCHDGIFSYDSPIMSSPTITKTNVKGGPTLNNGEIMPIYGYEGLTEFRFTVNYSDPDNNAPTFINITLDGLNHTMSQYNDTDTNYMDGSTFEFTTTLEQKGSHLFHFNCSDGKWNASDGSYSNPYVKETFIYEQLSLQGFKIGAVLSYSSDNPLEKYAKLKSKLLERGAELSTITDSITPNLLNQYDLLWFDDFGNYPPSAERDYIHNWINRGGCIIATGTYIYNTKFAIFDLLGLSTYTNFSSDNYKVTTEISGHPITQNVDEIFISYPYYYFNLDSRQDATSCVRVMGNPLAVALEEGNGAFAAINDGYLINDYYIDYNDNFRLASNSFGWLKSISEARKPHLTDPSLHPSSGNQSTLFKFSVNYTENFNYSAQYVNLVINGTKYVMYQNDTKDVDYTDGCLYNTSLFLQPGTYEYYFECSNGDSENQTQSQKGPVVSYTNKEKVNLTSSSVNPAKGERFYSIFTFTVNYSDPDNNAPKYVKLDIDGINYTIGKADSSDENYMDGCIYQYQTGYNSLGNHTFKFLTFDGGYRKNTTGKIFQVVDTKAPDISCIYPLNITYHSSTIFVNVSSKAVDLNKCWYKLYNLSANSTNRIVGYANGTGLKDGCTNLTLGEGIYRIDLFVKDTVGNVNSTSVIFTVDLSSQEEEGDDKESGNNDSLPFTVETIVITIGTISGAAVIVIFLFWRRSKNSLRI